MCILGMTCLAYSVTILWLYTCFSSLSKEDDKDDIQVCSSKEQNGDVKLVVKNDLDGFQYTMMNESSVK